MSMTPSPPSPRRVAFVRSFGRSQLTSFAATAVDFGLLFGLVELLGVWYVVATAIGALAGAITNFLLNRRWTFEATHGGLHGQALRYAIVSLGSMAINTAGTYLVTEFGKIPYGISVIGVSLLVGFFFNFPLQRHFVFR
jgi:putative flippase GtrA